MTQLKFISNYIYITNSTTEKAVSSKKNPTWFLGHQLAQLVKQATLDLGDMSSSPPWGTELN